MAGLQELIRRALSRGSQTAPALIDDVLEESGPLIKRASTEATEVAPEVIGKGVKSADDVAEAIEVPFREITPTTGMDDMARLKRMDPRLAGIAAALGLGGAAMMGGDDEQPPVPQSAAVQAPAPVKAPVPEGMESRIAQDIKASMTSAPAEQAGVETEPDMSDADMKRNFEQELLDAQGASNSNAFQNIMLRAANQAGAGIASLGAGSQVKPDYSGVEALAATAGQPVKDVTARFGARKEQQAFDKAQDEINDEKKLSDPNSDISKTTVAQLAKYGIKVRTAKEAKQLSPQIFNLLLQERAAANAKQLAEIEKTGKGTKTGIDFVKGAQKQLLKPYQEYQKVNTAYNSLEQLAKAKESGPNDIAILYDFIKTLDPNSVVREGEIHLSKQGMSALEGLGVSATRLTKGVLLSPAFRQGIVQIAKNKRDQAFSNYDQIRQPYLAEAASVGLSDEEVKRFDFGANEGSKSDEATVPLTTEATGTVKVRRISDGVTKEVPAASAAKMDKTKYEIIH